MGGATFIKEITEGLVASIDIHNNKPQNENWGLVAVDTEIAWFYQQLQFE